MDSDSKAPSMRIPRTLRKRVTHGESEGASSLVGFLVAGLIFLAAFAALLQTLSSTSFSSGESAELEGAAQKALDVLTQTPGVPANWGTPGGPDPDTVQRVGLLKPLSRAIVDSGKFQAISNSSLVDEPNHAVDYPSARRALGLDSYSFHLRTYPVLPVTVNAPYGLDPSFSSYRVAYVGDFESGGESSLSRTESYALKTLGVAFDNRTYDSSRPPGSRGDKFPDNNASALRDGLVPLLSGALSVRGAQGSDRFTFQRINSSLLSTISLAPHGGSYAFGLTDGTSLSYDKNKNLEVALFAFNGFGLATATVEGYYYISTGDPDDSFRFSVGIPGPLGSIVWTDLSPPISSTAGGWGYFSAPLSLCVPCLSSSTVFVGVRFTSDNDNTRGVGVILDDISVRQGPTRVAFTGFETPLYSMLLIGSNVDQNALTPSSIKYSIMNYVLSGGRLVVLGSSEQNTNWLLPLFSVATRPSAQPLTVPDPTNPILTVPNVLSWANYPTSGYVWRFSSQDALRFVNVVSAGSDSILALSKRGSFGAGSIVLTTYLPGLFGGDEIFKFLANVLTHGKYYRLFVDLGPTIPSGVLVSSAQRTLLVDRTLAGTGEFIEISFVLYVWK